MAIVKTVAIILVVCVIAAAGVVSAVIMMPSAPPTSTPTTTPTTTVPTTATTVTTPTTTAPTVTTTPTTATTTTTVTETTSETTTSPTTTPTTVATTVTTTTTPPTTSPTTTETTTTTTTAEVSKLIYGFGFKEGAWANYTIKSGVKSVGNKTEIITEVWTVKMVSYTIQQKIYRGIEIERKAEEEPEMRGFILWGEAGDLIQGIQADPAGCICTRMMVTPLPQYVPATKETIGEKYEVEERFDFIGKDRFKTESGKEVEVLKFMSAAYVKNETIIDEVWISPQVPFYYVYLTEYAKSGPVAYEVILIDFDAKGGEPYFTQEAIENCLQRMP